MKRFIYCVHQCDAGNLHTIVTRIEDGATKYFFQKQGTKAGLEKFFNSMTDELIDGYWPRSRKKDDTPFDNWAFLGNNPGREEVERLALIDLTRARLS